MSSSFTNFRVIPPSALVKTVSGQNSNFLTVLAVGSTLKDLKMWMSPNCTCILPNLSPMHDLGPVPNGSYKIN